jgi:DNA-3-methyladenine glycosylase II
VSHRKALNHLKRVDPVMARLIKAVGPCRFGARTDHTHFYHLARAIVYQQLSTKAASTIHGRFVALFPTNPPHPRHVAEASDVSLRGAGLSRQKSAYIKDLAGKVHNGQLPLERIEALGDADVIEALTQVKGIGRWSAQMFLMFRLGRPDVLPELDLGIRKAVQRAYRLRTMPSPKRVLKIGRTWSPYASIASWYLWRSLEL